MSNAEEKGNNGNPAPPSDKRKYTIQIDKSQYQIDNPEPTARDLLILAGKTPPEHFALYFKPKKGAPERIEIDQTVDLREPGKERFVTLPLDQTEGLGQDRADFDLPSEDMEWLEDKGLRYERVLEGRTMRVIVYDYPVPDGFNVAKVDINVRIEPNYPDTQIDMAYFYPPLSRRDGRQIRALSSDTFDGKNWQRWSRHRTPANPWRPGIDNLGTHFALIESWLERETTKG